MEIRLMIVKGLPDFVDSVFVGQVTVHEAAKKGKGEKIKKNSMRHIFHETIL